MQTPMMIRPSSSTQFQQSLDQQQQLRSNNAALMRPPPPPSSNLAQISTQMSSMTLQNQDMNKYVPQAQQNSSYATSNNFSNQNPNNYPQQFNQQMPPPNHFQPVSNDNNQMMTNGQQQQLTNNGPSLDGLPHMPPKPQIQNQFNPPTQTIYPPQSQMYPTQQQPQFMPQNHIQQQQQQPINNQYLSGPPPVQSQMILNQQIPPRPLTPTQFNNQLSGIPSATYQQRPPMGPPIGVGGMRPPSMQMPIPGQPQQQIQPPFYPQQMQPPSYPQQMQPPQLQQQQQPQAQPQARIDPDAIPNPIDVMQANSSKQGDNSIFRTNEIGQLPPLTTTDFIVKDEGNCNPRFIRSTMYSIPNTHDLLKQSKIPMALCVTPFARLRVPDEMEPPVSNLGDTNPIRCKRCKAYMSPYMQFIENGRRFQCPYCDDTSEVPQEYFNHLDHMGKRVDRYERPELCLGSYEYTAGKDYCKNQQLPNPPVFIFMIDVSSYSIRTGLLNLICSRIKSDILPNLPCDDGQSESDVRVGFVTYDRELHFYNLKSSLVSPQMMVVSDLEEIFVPMMNGFLVKPSESSLLIDLLLEQLPQIFADTKETELVLGPVIEAGIEAMCQASSPGKLFIFHSNLPTVATHGQLKTRDDRKHLGTDKEKMVFQAQSDYYAQLGKKCIDAGCSVDLFFTCNQFIDVATIGELGRRCGGKIYKYDFFNATTHGDRLMFDLRKDVETSVAFDAIMKVRTSTGIKAVDHLGNFNVTGTNDVEMACVTRDTSISVELKHDDKLNENLKLYIQAAILFTSVSGQRRIRIHNLTLNICNQFSTLFPTLELDTIINYMSKLACRSVLVSTPKSISENIVQQTASILACYRRNCTNTTSRGQFILPETLKLMPLFINSLLKCDAISGVKMVTVDERAYQMYRLMSLDVASTFNYFYPRLISLHDLESAQVPRQMRLSYERLKDDGIYLLENGLVMFLWIGQNVSSNLIQNLFGSSSVQQMNIEQSTLIEIDSPISLNVRSIIKTINEQRNSMLKLIIVRQKDTLEAIFKNYLVEDKNLNMNGTSYVDFLYQLHHEIRNLLN